MPRKVLEKIVNTLAGIVLAAFGCSFDAPRLRMGNLPTPPPGPRFSNPNALGQHSYQFNPFEDNGIVYTCKGGAYRHSPFKMEC